MRRHLAHNVHTRGGLEMLAVALGNTRADALVLLEPTCASWAKGPEHKRRSLSVHSAAQLSVRPVSGLALKIQLWKEE